MNQADRLSDQNRGRFIEGSYGRLADVIYEVRRLQNKIDEIVAEQRLLRELVEAEILAKARTP